MIVLRIICTAIFGIFHSSLLATLMLTLACNVRRRRTFLTPTPHPSSFSHFAIC